MLNFLSLAALFLGMELTAAQAATNILVNAGFESGSLSPWFVADGTPVVTDAYAHSGTYSVAAYAEDAIEQNFSPVSVSAINQVSFWVDFPNNEILINAFIFFYSDGTSNYSYVETNNPGGWTFFNITEDLEPGKLLTGFLIYGTSGGPPNPAYLDDFLIARVPEPSTWVLMLAGFAGLAFAGYRRTRRGASVTGCSGAPMTRA